MAQHLAQAPSVSLKLQLLLLGQNIEHQANASFAPFGAQGLDSARGQSSHAEELHVKAHRTDGLERDDVVYQAIEASCLFQHQRQRVQLFWQERAQLLLEEQFGVALYQGQRCAQLVRYIANES